MSGNACESRESDTANMIAAPTPWTARDELSIQMSCAAAQASDVTVKIESPTVNIMRRPSRSASEPAVSTTAASASVGVDDPLEAREARVQIGGDVGERGVHDR